MSLPRISILMPIRNEERYLSAALESLYRQTLTEWELLAVDDGSSDASPDILADAACHDMRIRIIRSEGRGLVAALNEGLSSCRATLVARMDGDDICHPRRFELQADYLDEHPDVGLVACSFRHFPRSSLKQGMLAYETWQNNLLNHELILRDIFVESPFVHPSVTVRRHLLEQLGGYRDCSWAEDYDLWLRMANMGIRFARLPRQLFFWRDHPERATRKLEAYTATAFRACKAYHLMQVFLKDSKEVIIAGAGLEGRAWQRILTANGLRVSNWLDLDPRKIGRVLHGAPVTHPKDFNFIQGRKMLVAIGVRGAREEFRTMIGPMGLQERVDFICVS